MPDLSITEIKAFFDKEFPNNNLVIEQAGQRQARIKRYPQNENLRPGGTVSGPFMMGMVDTAIYVAIFGELGLMAMAVTTNLNINFLRKPVAGKDVIAECTLIKVGKKLVVGEVSLYSDGDPEPIAHAVGTYSIPPR